MSAPNKGPILSERTPTGIADPETSTTGAAQKRFGAFGGVFTPSLLTILGVVMYLRMGWVVGQTGLAGALLIVALSHVISLLTGLSVSSIATNRTVGAGGAYFMISRSLGAAAGAAIGIPLFFGQALSVTFYVIGFTESLTALMPDLPTRLVGTVICAGLTLLSMRSAELALKAQYVIMAAIGVSLVSFFMGGAHAPPTQVDWVNPDGVGFADVFAVFFPAVTGIMAGVSMSGDLRDPRAALPKGTLAAIVTGMIIYTVIPIWLAFNATSGELIGDRQIFWTLSAVPALIFVGVWGATLSSALGSIMTAPRTLQALAADGLAPRFLATGHGPTNEPRIGTMATFALAEVGILLGDLDAIAPILTMFFLATYGFTNLACGLERWAANPSFRPSFRVPALSSLAGALACFYVMSIINMLAMLAAVAVSSAIYAIAQRRALNTTYGDARHGIWAALVRTALQRLRRVEFHPLNWRPNLLIMGGMPSRRTYLLELGSALVQERGVVTHIQLLPGRVVDLAEERVRLQNDTEARLAASYPHVFARVEIVSSLHRGAVSVVQSYGVGTFEANTVLLGWPKSHERADEYVEMLRDLSLLDRSLLVVRHRADQGFGLGQTIHIWWGGLQGNGALMLVVGYLLTAAERWRNARVTVVTVVDEPADCEPVMRALQETLDNARLDAEPRVLLRDGRRVLDLMREVSEDADLALVGLRLPAPGESSTQFFERNDALLSALPTTLLVAASPSFKGAPVLFDE